MAIQRLPALFCLRRGTSSLANSVLRSPLRCLRGHFDAGRGAKPLWPELAVDVRSSFATRWRSGFLIDCLVSEISLNFFVAISGKSSAIAQRRRASGYRLHWAKTILKSAAQGKEQERGPKASGITPNQRVMALAVRLSPGSEKENGYPALKNKTASNMRCDH